MVPQTIAAVEGFDGMDSPARLRIMVDAYGLDAADRRRLLGLFPSLVDTMQAFMKGRVAAGDPVFTEVNRKRDPQRYAKILAWLDERHEEFAAALGTAS